MPGCAWNERSVVRVLPNEACSTYSRYGKEHCARHKLKEEELDVIIDHELHALKVKAHKNWEAINQYIRDTTAQANVNQRRTENLQQELSLLEEQYKGILVEMAGSTGLRREAYETIVTGSEQRMKQLKEQINDGYSHDRLIHER